MLMFNLEQNAPDTGCWTPLLTQCTQGDHTPVTLRIGGLAIFCTWPVCECEIKPCEEEGLAWVQSLDPLEVF